MGNQVRKIGAAVKMPLKDLKMPVKLLMKGQKMPAPDNSSHYFILLLNTQLLIPLWATIGYIVI